MPSEYWGMEESLNLYSCDPEIIRNADKIKEYVIKLCDLIEMKRFGETQIVNFGEDPRVSGFSMTQLIETSLISGHFANQSNAAYINVFSCKEFDIQLVEDFTKDFFKAKEVQGIVNYRE